MKYSILAIINQEFKSWKDCYTRLADQLKAENRVKSGFLESVLSREEEYPTGLVTSADIGVAIPHPYDGSLTVHPSIAVAVLPRPIEVGSMIDPDKQVKVSLVFMLALNKSDDHLNVLGHLMDVFQDEKALLEIANAKDAQFIEEKIASFNL